MPLEGDGGEQLVTTGGLLTAFVAAAGSLNVIARPGRLCRIVITTVGTATATIYDNASGAASGNVLFVVPANATLGEPFDIQLRCAKGIYVAGQAGSPGFALGYC